MQFDIAIDHDIMRGFCLAFGHEGNSGPSYGYAIGPEAAFRKIGIPALELGDTIVQNFPHPKIREYGSWYGKVFWFHLSTVAIQVSGELQRLSTNALDTVQMAVKHMVLKWKISTYIKSYILTISGLYNVARLPFEFGWILASSSGSGSHGPLPRTEDAWLCSVAEAMS